MNGPKTGRTNPVTPSRLKNFKARWPAWVTLFIVALLYEALPKIFYWGPRGLMIGLVTLLTLPMIISHWNNNLRNIRTLMLSVNVLVTFYIIISVSRLILAAFEGQIGPKHLLLSALILWGTNILAFALWYWTLDAGGPHQREAKEFNGISAFLFPQKQISLMGASNLPDFIKNWTPHFIDYLFLAFNTSTAFSPTDTPILNKWAKCMSMIQAIISLTIIMVLGARAINILNDSSSYFVS